MLLSPQQGETQLLTDLLSSGENWTLKLFQNNYTPTSADTPASYTEATFTGYSSKTLTRTVTGSTWSTPTAASPSVSQYNAGTPQSWSATSAQAIYGYYLVGATSGKLIWAEKFASPISLVNPSTLTLVPQVSLT